MTSILIALSFYCTEYRAAFISFNDAAGLKAQAKVFALYDQKPQSIVDVCEPYWYVR